MDNLSPVFCKFNADQGEFEFLGYRKDGFFVVDGKSHNGFITGSNPRMVTNLHLEW